MKEEIMAKAIRVEKKEMKKDFRALAEYYAAGMSGYKMKEVLKHDRYGNESMYGMYISEKSKNHFIQTDVFGNRCLEVSETEGNEPEGEELRYDGCFEIEKGDKVRVIGSASHVVEMKKLRKNKGWMIKEYEKFASEFFKEKGITEKAEILMLLVRDHVEQEADVKELLRVKRKEGCTEIGFRGEMKMRGRRFIELVGYRVGDEYYIDENIRVMHESTKEEWENGKFKGRWSPFFMEAIMKNVR